MPPSRRRYAPALLCALAFASPISASRPAHEPQQQQPTASPAPHPYSYEGGTGPDKWAALRPEYATCGTGTLQSPIDIDPASISGAATEVRTSYAGAFTSVYNTGLALQFNAGPGNRLDVGADSYELVQMHLHAPSEHTVGGKVFPLEAHFVHRDSHQRLAVLGLLFNEGRDGADDEGVAALWSTIPPADGKPVAIAQPLDGLWQPSRHRFIAYEGSLTTPPCREGVRWFVADTGLPVSPAQVARFKAAVGANARPVQATNGRKVGR